jgi:hypothetical protein
MLNYVMITMNRLLKVPFSNLQLILSILVLVVLTNDIFVVGIDSI